MNLSSDAALRTLEAKFQPQRAVGAQPAVIAVQLSGADGGEWFIAIADGAARVHAGTASKPNVTFKASAEDFLAVLSGRLDGARAMMTGRLRASGDLRLLAQFAAWFAL